MNHFLRKHRRALLLLIPLLPVWVLALRLTVSWVSPNPERPDQIEPFSVHAVAESPESTGAMQASSPDSLYQVLLTEINTLFDQKQYEACLEKLKQANTIKPGVSSVQERIVRVEGLIAQQQKDNQEYKRLTAMADSYFNEKKYLDAKSTYQLAIDIKPDDPYARQQLQKTMELLRSQKAQNILYDVAVASADRLFQAMEYDKAKLEYENASKILPDASYPREQINAILKIQVDRQVREELYNTAIAAGDRFYTAKNYQRALKEFQQALTQKPDELYPKQKVEEITGILAELAVREEAYKQAIASGDQLFGVIRYPDARLAYEEALTHKPQEPYPAQKIREIDGILDRIARVDAKYDMYLNLADSLYMEKEFIGARQNYQLALEVKPVESYPKAMITKAEAGIQGLEASAVQQALDDNYRQLIVMADRYFSESAWEPAMEEYRKAANLKPSESYPRDQIRLIEEKREQIVRDQLTEQTYRELVSRADRFFDALDYDSARVRYQEALAMRPGDNYPKLRIGQMDSIQQAVADAKFAELTRLQSLEDQYASAISRGDSLLAARSLVSAKAAYGEASAIKPAESYPKTKLSEIDALLQQAAAQQELDEVYTGALARADGHFQASRWDSAVAVYSYVLTLKPGEAYPQQKLGEIDSIRQEIARLQALDKQYGTLVAEGERLLAADSLQTARNRFTQALQVKPEETLPAERIRLINSRLQDLAAEQTRVEQYSEFIRTADERFGAEQYPEARALYQQALNLYPAEEYPHDKIVEIDAVLAELARLQSLEDQYTSAIARGDSLLAAGSLIPAKTAFGEASGVKPEEKYPKTKMAEIDGLLEQLAGQQRLDLAYSEALARADGHFQASRWDSAVAVYSYVLTLKPGEAYPQQKLGEIDSIRQEIARLKALDDQYAETIGKAGEKYDAKQWRNARVLYTEAQSLKPGESLPAERISAIDGFLAEIAQQEELERQYLATIRQGDSLLTGEQWEPALSRFQEALRLKPGEPYPQGKIDDIRLRLQEIATLEALERRYSEIIDSADRFFQAQSWDQAETGYSSAREIKPKEAYPARQLQAIDSIRKEIARQGAIDLEYAGLITIADRMFTSRSLDSALAVYRQAGALRPDRDHWQIRVTEIERIKAEEQKRRSDYLAAIKQADDLFDQQQWEPAREAYQNAGEILSTEAYPKQRITEINRILAELQGKRQTFDKLVASGDQFLVFKQFVKAKDNYQQALDLFPEEGYPKDQIRRVNVKIDSIYRANKADYDKAVGEGDGFFYSFEYDRAIDAYTRAMAFLSMEDYPREMIAKIRRTIEENAIADVLSSPVIIKAGEEVKFPFEPVNIASRRNNFIYLKMRNLTGESFNTLLRYGKGDQTNGGLAIRNLTADGELNERLISVKNQDPWFREDNNWISIYPQGGDIEVSFIQVSRAID